MQNKSAGTVNLRVGDSSHPEIEAVSLTSILTLVAIPLPQYMSLDLMKGLVNCIN